MSHSLDDDLAGQASGAGTPGHGDHDEHGEPAVALGPIDWRAWGAGLLGVAAGLAVVFCLYVAAAA